MIYPELFIIFHEFTNWFSKTGQLCMHICKFHACIKGIFFLGMSFKLKFILSLILPYLFLLIDGFWIFFIYCLIDLYVYQYNFRHCTFISQSTQSYCTFTLLYDLVVGIHYDISSILLSSTKSK